MRVFVTGATGYVGNAVVSRLLRAGHQVSALVRTEAGALRLAAGGSLPVLGELRALPSLVAAMADHDAVIHTAFEYRADGSEADDVDQQAVDSMVAAMRRGDRCRHLVYTSNGFLLADIPPPADGADATVDEGIDIARAVRPGTWRLDVERRVLDAGGGDLATAVVRVGAVYGGVGGSFPDFFHHARTTGTLGYVGAGANRWSLIHRDDLADLFATIVEHDGRGVFHGVDGAPLAMGEIMALVARGAAARRGGAVDVHGVAPDQARSELPYYASVLACDLAMVTPRARALGWTPTIASFRDGVAAAAGDVLD